MASKKYNQPVNTVQKKQSHRYRGPASGNQRWWPGDGRVREWEVGTPGYRMIQGRRVQHRGHSQHFDNTIKGKEPLKLYKNKQLKKTWWTLPSLKLQS